MIFSLQNVNDASFKEDYSDVKCIAVNHFGMCWFHGSPRAAARSMVAVRRQDYVREAQLHGTSLQSSDPTKATGQSIPDTLPFGVI